MRTQRAERLRFAVNSLPPETQRAMLDGINQNRIVTGANSDHRGGLCPMLAADRNAFQVTPLAEIFATAWDRYTGTSFVNVTRRTACERDLNVLRSMLEMSLKLHPSAEQPPPPRVAAPVIAPELVAMREAKTVSARLEIIRALEMTSPSASRPAVPRAATLPTPRPAAWVDPVAAEQPASRVDRFSRLAPPRSGSPGLAPVAAASARPPAARSLAEAERQRAREIVANQAKALRPRQWPRVAEPDASVAETRSAATPAPVPVPVAGRPEQGDRVQELAAKSGWSWLRPFSSYDDYEQTLTDLGETQRGPGADDGGSHRDDTRRREPSQV